MRFTAVRPRSRPFYCWSNRTLLLLALVLLVPSRALKNNNNNNLFLDDSTAAISFLPTVGPIEDAKCNIEDLEQANDSQLYSILHDIKKTDFFSKFVVDLDHKCPLRSWRKGGGGGGSGGDDDNDDDEKVGEGEDEEDFACTGGPDDDDDEDSPKLCEVDFESNALHSISVDGFESKAQKKTFDWKQMTDMVVSDDKQEPCESTLLPDSFWMDICSNITVGKGTQKVNLALNPEHNTGYNGTHIWKAIYEENCIAVDDNHSDMCLEERVLYRLLSGLHTSTTLSIAMNYYPPSKRKNRPDWMPNPKYFMKKFENNPEYIRNLHFSYVVLLRALRKASKFLHSYEIRTGNIVQDETATVLLKRLLDSAILGSCSNVFSAFDESLMFQDNDNVVSLQRNFKGVFHNVSSILDCVQCQQCKLHGKMAMLGYGAAIKVLFIDKDVVLERNEIVALINTIAKFSESIRQVRELTHMYWEEQQKNGKQQPPSASAAAPPGDILSLDRVDLAVGLAASLGRNELVSFEREAELVQLAFAKNPELLILAKHYANDENRFLQLSKSIVGSIDSAEIGDGEPDAIVVGTGLAGLATTLNILDRGGRVVLLEKEHTFGGNSNKASSGINACPSPKEHIHDVQDNLEIFRNDTIRSAGESARPDLIEALVSRSADAVKWLQERVGVDLSLLAQLGGHSAKRTHRPKNAMVGAEVIYKMQKAVRSFEKTGEVEILLDSKVTGLVTDTDGAVIGVKYVSNKNGGEESELRAPNVILATGGFASDRSKGSYLDHYRPELLKMPATAGPFSTGDGISLARSLGAGTVDMDKVQIHPTGWVDPTDPDNNSKTLAAELMRGVGGILLNSKGERFCNEVGTRAYVTDRMLSHNPSYVASGKWELDAEIPTFYLVLSSSAYEDGKKHVDMYTHKGLMTRLEGVSELASWAGLPKSTVVATLQKYRQDAAKGEDEFGKSVFRGVPPEDLEKETFYAGRTTPVLHYCMGGITIDTEGNVLKDNGDIIPGLHAAGEVSGGVHGVNRLAGNSLLECTVYGTIVGQKIPVKTHPNTVKKSIGQQPPPTEKELRKVPLSELQKHNTPDDCWVSIHDVVYDLTEFAEEHPAGAESIYELAGKCGTEAFAAVHNEGMMEDFAEDRIGIFDPTS